MADDFSQKAVAGIVSTAGWFHPSSMPRSGHPPVNLTVPSKVRFGGQSHPWA
jgi:hypothetical protein